MADITFVPNTWGYSAPGADLKPANFQKIDDALNAVVHKSIRGSALLDADTVSEYGIGSVKLLSAGYNIDLLTVNGKYSVEAPTITGGAALSGAGNYSVDVFNPGDGGYYIQFVQRSGSREYLIRDNGTGSWVTGKMWNSLNDGNGGQPPGPKPNATASSIGEWKIIQTAAAANLDAPAGGTWAILGSAGGSDPWASNGVFAGVYAGGTGLVGASAQAKTALCWRIA